MKCPMCADEVLQPYEHALGIDLDFCPTCRGIWFDRSELEYLLGRALATPAPQQATPVQRVTDSTALASSPKKKSRQARAEADLEAHLRPMPTEGRQKQKWIDEMMDFFD